MSTSRIRVRREVNDEAMGCRLAGREWVAQLDTPSVVLDLDAVDRNIARMQSYCDRYSIDLRPHVKTHKMVGLARAQVQAGAVGIACQTLGEAELMIAAGLDDVTVTFPIVGEVKVRRLSALAGRARISLVADSSEVLDSASVAALQAGASIRILVDCDTGFARTGVQTVDDAVALACRARELSGLEFAGFFTYPTLAATGAWLRAAVRSAETAGLRPEVVSSGGTPAAFRTHEVPELTELRVGTYVYGDRACIADGSVAPEDCALRIATTVVSRPTLDRAILDAGSKTITSDPAAGVDPDSLGLIVEYPTARLYALSEEHGHLEVDGPRPSIGEIVTLIPNHACGVTNLHDEVWAHRSGRFVEARTVDARGMVR